MNGKQELNWEVGWSEGIDAAPERMVPSRVPGAVQLDWAKAEGWAPHTYGDNWRDYEWMEDRYWTYRTFLPELKANGGDRLVFVSKGVDYSFHIRLQGQIIHSQEGMFTPVELDLTERYVPGGVLEIIVEPAPKLEGAPKDRQQAAHSCKPPVSYGWDWHPRLFPLVIWDDTYL